MTDGRFNSRGFEINDPEEMEVNLNEITDENLIVAMNKILVDMGGRRRVISVIERRISFVSRIFFQTKNGFALVVFIENDRIKSIIQQIDRMKSYTFLGNGQAGQNARNVYDYLIGEGEKNEFYLSQYV